MKGRSTFTQLLQVLHDIQKSVIKREQVDMPNYYTQILLYFYALLYNFHQFYIICVFYCTYCNCILLHANK